MDYKDVPYFDSHMQPQQTNYSSLGPAYEQVLENQETGYDTINRCGSPRPCPLSASSGLCHLTVDCEHNGQGGETAEYNTLERGEETEGEREESRLPQEYEVVQCTK